MGCDTIEWSESNEARMDKIVKKVISIPRIQMGIYIEIGTSDNLKVKYIKCLQVHLKWNNESNSNSNSNSTNQWTPYINDWFNNKYLVRRFIAFLH